MQDESESMVRKALAPDRSLPVPLGPAGPRPSLVRCPPETAFLAHLLVARAPMPRRRISLDPAFMRAISAYGRGAALSARRLPAGWRTSISA